MNDDRARGGIEEEAGPAAGSEGEAWVDRTLSIDQVVRLAGRWFPVVTVLTFLPYLLIWGLPAWPEWPGLWAAVVGTVKWVVIGLLVYAVSALLHEALHVVAMLVVGRVSASGLRFGMRLSEGVLYVHTPQPMSARAYRVVLLLPAVVLGLAPAAAGTLAGFGWMVLYGYVMLMSAVGDLIVLQLMRDVGPDERVRDHPHQIGCQVMVRRSTE